MMIEQFLAVPRATVLTQDMARLLAPSYERLAILSERLNRPEAATAYAEKFMEIWADAEAEIKPRVETATGPAHRTALPPRTRNRE